MKDDGSFKHSFSLSPESAIPGNYNVLAHYGDLTARAGLSMVDYGQVDYVLTAGFFFVDIVGLSDFSISTVHDQKERIMALNKCINDCRSYTMVSDDSKYILPTGDGAAIGFVGSLTAPLALAIELHHKVHEYNKQQTGNEQLKVRIGHNNGPVLTLTDIKGDKNVWGRGIVMARRIMDLGNDGHILVSESTGRDLFNLNNEYRGILKYLGEYEIKHGQKVGIYNAHGEDFGNPKPPKKKKHWLF